jgi:hypothetical protein
VVAIFRHQEDVLMNRRKQIAVVGGSLVFGLPMLEMIAEYLLVSYHHLLVNSPPAREAMVSTIRIAVVAGLLILLLVALSTIPARLRDSSKKEATNVHLKTAENVFHYLGLVIPLRLRKEDEGDALETINNLVAQGKPQWEVYVKLTSAIGWILANAAREIVTSFAKKGSNR